MLVIAGSCVAIGRVAQHAYVAAAAAVAMLVLGRLWPWLILRFVSVFSNPAVIRSRPGTSVELTIDVASRWPFPLPGMEVDGKSDGALSVATPLLTLRHGRRRVAVGIGALRRGVFHLSDLTIGTSFPFGLWHGRRAIEGPGQLIVWPSVQPVDSELLRIASHALAVEFPSSGILADGELAGVRGYRRGDAMRSIHWIQTARHDRLIVRERAGGERRGCVVCLDTRRSAYDDEEAFERAVSIAAGAIEEGLRDGLHVELRIGTARMPVTDDLELTIALDVLAEVAWTDAIALPDNRHGLLITTAKGWASAARASLRPWLVTGGHP